MTPQERRSYDNGIWMCGTHGDLIDKDAVRFTIPLLKQWRELAERRAEVEQAHRSFDPQSMNLMRHDVDVARNTLSEQIVGDAFADAGTPIFWGQGISDAVRDFAFEVAQNALTHGGASVFRIEFTPRKIELFDNGVLFDPRGLAGTRGGGLAARHLRDLARDRIIVSNERRGHDNVCSIHYIRRLEDITAETPCQIDLSATPTIRGRLDSQAVLKVRDCEAVYLLLPDYMSFSRAVDFETNLVSSLGKRKLIFVGRGISAGVQGILSKIPGSSFIELT